MFGGGGYVRLQAFGILLTISHMEQNSIILYFTTDFF